MKGLFRQFGQWVLTAVWMLAGAVFCTLPAAALTPESPEVKVALEKAIKFLESDEANDRRAGARALVGLALMKNGAPHDHPKIDDAVAVIRQTVGSREPAQLTLDLYSTGLSIIFLVNLDSSKYSPEIDCLLQSLKLRQKPHGGWGYADKPTGDTSMTQYAVLSSWEAAQEGFAMPRESIEAVTTWLLKTQDPNGGFGYQGEPSESFTPVAQKGVRHSMCAAGLGSLYICADLLGFVERVERPDPTLPAALREVKLRPDAAKDPTRPRSKVDLRLIKEAEVRGNRWMKEHFEPAPKGWVNYYLYAYERYSSFRELAEGKFEKEPRWYTQGARHLIQSQAENGSWEAKAGVTADTAFGALFLLRSTKKSIEKARGLGRGTLQLGRGLPAETEAVELRLGRVVAKGDLPLVEELAEMLRNPERADFDKALDAVAKLSPRQGQSLLTQHSDRLRELSLHRSPTARAAAIRGLGLSGAIDVAPTLIRALGDPDPRVEAEAREGLTRLSRQPFESRAAEQDAAVRRRAEIEHWKAWYLGLRPEAEFDE